MFNVFTIKVDVGIYSCESYGLLKFFTIIFPSDIFEETLAIFIWR